MTSAGTLEKRVRSNSQLKDILYCGWQFRLKRLFHVEEAPSVWLAGGIAFHSATEEFDLASFQGQLDQFDPADFTASFLAHFDRRIESDREKYGQDVTFRAAGRKTKDKPDGENIDWWRDAGQKMVVDYIEWRIETNDTWEIAAVNGSPGVEVKVQALLGETPVVGYIDRVMRHRGTGQLLIMDLKSGSRMPADPTQLAMYSVLLEQDVGEPILWGMYYDARKGKASDMVDLSRFTAANLGLIFDTLDSIITAGNFLPHIDSHCNGCGVRAACIWQGGIDPTVTASHNS